MQRRYNWGVPDTQQPSPANHRPKRPFYSLETTGLIIMAILILILILIRYWHHIPWSVR